MKPAKEPIREPVLYLPALLTAVMSVVVAFQQPFDRILLQASLGFTLLTVAWTGMYVRLRRELPDHPLARTRIVTFHTGVGQHPGLLPMLRIVRFHLVRHRIDGWTGALIAGAALLTLSIIEHALRAPAS